MFGLDYLGLAKYARAAAAAHREGWAVGCFSHTFGDVLPALQLLLKTRRVPRVRIQLDWQDNHDYSKRFEFIRLEARRVAQFAKTYPEIDWRFSGACEHLLNNRQAQRLRDIVLEEAPFVTYVNTPMNSTLLKVGTKVINESHGSMLRGSRLDFSFDGANCVDKNVTEFKRKFRHCETFYFWALRFNGKWNAKDTTPRPERKGWPDTEFIRSVIALAKEKGNTSLPPKWIYKSHAENHGIKDPRAEKPVFIIPEKPDEIVLKTTDGKTITKLKYFGPFENLNRYYASKMGFRYPSPLEVWVGGKRHGVINPAFRDGVYR